MVSLRLPDPIISLLTRHLISLEWKIIGYQNMHQYASMMIPTWKPLEMLANLSLCQAPASNLLIPFEWTNGCYTFALQPWLDASHRWKWPQQEDPSSRPKNRKHPQNPPKLDRVFHHVHSCSPSKWISCFFSTFFSTIFIHIHEMVSI